MIRFVFCLIVLVVLTSCGLSPEALQATTTQVAGELYGTQTAEAPKGIETEEVALESEDQLPDAETQDEGQMILPQATPWPVEDLSEEDQAQLLCYQAAVLIYVDWAIHSHILDTYWPKIYSDREFTINKINELYWYTTHRPLQFIVDKGEPTVISENTTFYWDKSYYLNDQDLSHCGERFVEELAASQSYLGYHPWLPEGMGPTKSPPREGQVNNDAYRFIRLERSIASSWVRVFRLRLLRDHDLSPVYLFELERPIWEAAHARFGLDLPGYLQGLEVVR